LASLSVATIPALIAALNAAAPGDTVSLQAGNYGTATIGGAPNCGSTKPGAYGVTTCVTADLSRAVFTGLLISNSKGIVIVGPASNNSVWYGFRFYKASNVVLTGWHCTGGALAACVAIGSDSQDIVVSDGEASQHTGDCIDMNSVQRVTITRNYCHDNVQIPGKSPHPDVVQIWAIIRDGICVPTTDVTVENNHGRGFTQGIDTFGTPPTCPVQRIVIRHNLIESDGWWCYGLTQAVDSVLEDNTCVGTSRKSVSSINIFAGRHNVIRNNKMQGNSRF
jgi:hypothetical protein